MKDSGKGPPRDSAPKPNPQRKSYQDDPRYKQFYERLKRANTKKQLSSYDDEIRPMSLDELEKQGFEAGADDPTEEPLIKADSPHSFYESIQIGQEPRAPLRNVQVQDSQAAFDEAMSPGLILRFDDGSVAIYKDAVSGKDYALFYFLEPDGVLAPRGIFLEQYEFQRIGRVPDDVFTDMRAMGRWDRDAVIYHLDRFEHATHIRRLENRTPAPSYASPSAPGPVITPVSPRKPAPAPSSSAPAPAPSSSAPAPASSGSAPAPSSAPVSTSVPGRSPAVASVPERSPTPQPQPRNMLEKGRVLRINVAGRVWESVYWTSDEMGHILAHDTNREWSLMHLDLNRFKDCIEFGDKLAPERLAEIEQSLTKR